MHDVDLVTLGRVNMDLYSRDIGAGFDDIPSSFDAMVGGSPTNIAIGTARLGLRSVALTAVGDDEIGEYVKAFLQRENVITDFIPTKSQGKTAIAVLAVMPPDRFPLVFYRDNAADLYLEPADVDASPLRSARALLLSGNAFAKGACRDAATQANSIAADAGITQFLDLDLRPDQWETEEAFGEAMRAILPTVDVAIGTEEEFHTALAPAPSPAMKGEPLDESQKSDVREYVNRLSSDVGLVVLKRGASGVTLLEDTASTDVAGFPVTVVNTVGAGDSFASGLIARRLAGDTWIEAARYGNACGAICVTRHGCSLAMPTPAEVKDFMESRQ